MTQQIIFISSDKPFIWALKRVLLGLKEVKRIKVVKEIESVSHEDVVVFDGEKTSDIEEKVWKLRRDLRARCPVICLGFESEEHFRLEPQNLVFTERPYQYRYLSKPLSLMKFIKALNKMEPIYDAGTLNKEIRRYSNSKGHLGQLLHNLGNAILNKNRGKNVDSLNEIEKLLSYLEIGDEKKKDFIVRIDRIKKEIDFKEANSLMNDLYALLEGEVR